MLNKELYDILIFIKDRDESNPYCAIDVVNNFYSDKNIPFLTTDKNIEILFHCGYLETRGTSNSTYRTGYNGPVYLSASGYLAINAYERQIENECNCLSNKDTDPKGTSNLSPAIWCVIGIIGSFAVGAFFYFLPYFH